MADDSGITLAGVAIAKTPRTTSEKVKAMQMGLLPFIR